MGAFKPQLIVKCLIPVVMAGILGVYGMIVAVILLQKIDTQNYTWQTAYKHMASGLCTGFSQLVRILKHSGLWKIQAAGWAIGMVGDVAARSMAFQDRIFVGMLLILIFAEALGLFGLIVGILLT